MSIFNHNLVFRPLRGGIAVLNPIVETLGTIGLIATSNGQDAWIVSCYHVLCRPDASAFTEGEPIQQVIGDAQTVARNSTERAAANLDCAAARISDGVPFVPEILGLGRLTSPAGPEVGMRVLKSGRKTGITEGKIVAVNGNDVTIEAPDGFPANYEVSEPGDSGAVWVARDTGAPVALHTRGNDTGKERAFAARLTTVLQTLGLTTL